MWGYTGNCSGWVCLNKIFFTYLPFEEASKKGNFPFFSFFYIKCDEGLVKIYELPKAEEVLGESYFRYKKVSMVPVQVPRVQTQKKTTGDTYI